MRSEKVKVKVILLVTCALFLACISGVGLSNTGNTQNNQSEIFVDYELNHAPSPPVYVPDEFIVRFRSDIGERAINTINEKCGVSVKETLPPGLSSPGPKVLSIPQNKTVKEMVRTYENLSEVQYAHPSYIDHAFMVPNDPLYEYQWHLDNSTNEYNGINMESAWDLSTGSGVVVAVLDTGVAYEDYGSYCQAPDLAGTTFVPGYDFVNNDAHPNDDDVRPYAHGTHVAGTIAQITNNNDGFAGVAFDCSIMPVKIANAAGFEPCVKNMQKYITYLGSSNILRVKLLYP